MAVRIFVPAIAALLVSVTLTGCGGGGGEGETCKPETTLGELLRCKLLKVAADGSTETLSTDVALKGKSNIALLFGGQWCPWTRRLEESILSKTLEKLKAKSPDDTELVLLWASYGVNRSDNENRFNTWIKGKPWLSVPFATSMGYDGQEAIGSVRSNIQRAENRSTGTLAQKYTLSGYPTVVVIGQDGEVKYENFLATKLNETNNTVYYFNETTAPPSWLEVQDQIEAEIEAALMVV